MRLRVPPTLYLITALLALSMVWGAMIGCVPAPGKLDLQLFYIPDERGRQTYENIKYFEIAMTGSGISSDGQKTPIKPDKTGLILPNVGCDTTSKGNIEVQVEVVGFSDETSSRPSYSGRQVKFLPCGRPKAVSVFISPINSFSPLTEFVGQPDEVSRFAQSEERMAGHRVVRLPDGRLFFTGGANLSAAGKVDSVSIATTIFDPETGTFTPGPKMSSARAFHTATLVVKDADVKVVVIGGIDVSGTDTIETVKSVDIFTLNDINEFDRTAGPQLEGDRAFHTVTLTPQKNLFVYGGFMWTPGAKPEDLGKSAGSWEILSFDNGSLVNTKEGALTGQYPRGMHTATLLPDDTKILIVGGIHVDSSGTNALDTYVEVSFNADETGININLGATKLKNKRAGHTATLIDSDRLLAIVGGMEPGDNLFLPKTVHKSIDIFNAQGSLQSSYNVTLTSPRVFHTTSLLQDGRVLVFGGLLANNEMNSKAEIFGVDTKGLKEQPLLVGHIKNRFHHSGIVQLNGNLLIFGGATFDSQATKPVPPIKYVTLNKGEIFNPGPAAQ